MAALAARRRRAGDRSFNSAPLAGRGIAALTERPPGRGIAALASRRQQDVQGVNIQPHFRWD